MNIKAVCLMTLTCLGIAGSSWAQEGVYTLPGNGVPVNSPPGVAAGNGFPAGMNGPGYPAGPGAPGGYPPQSYPFYPQNQPGGVMPNGNGEYGPVFDEFDANTEYFAPSLRLGSQFGDGIGWNTDGDYFIDLFNPISLTDDNDLLFFNGRAYRSFNSQGERFGGNMGVGYRLYNPASETMFGISGWVDIDGAQDQTWRQYGASIEAVTHGFEIRVNGYLADGDGTKVLGQGITSQTGFMYRGNNIVADRVTSRVAQHQFDMIDAEIGGPIPLLGLNDHLYFGGYWFNNNEADISRGGTKIRYQAYPIGNTQVGVEFRHDDTFGSSVWSTASIELPQGSLRDWGNRLLDGGQPKMHLTRPVERLWRIPVKQIASSTVENGVPLIDPTDGRPIFVLHVNPNGTAGNGTFENMANSSSFVNTPQADIIRVLPGNFTSPGPLQLFDNQRLLAATRAHTLNTTLGPFNLPLQVTGADPILTNLGGGNVVQLGNNNEVSGFAINGNGTGIGIAGSNFANFNLNRLNITNATDGIQLTNFAQTTPTDPLGRPVNNIQDVTVTNSQTAGVNLQQNNGGAGVVTISQLTAERNGTDGLLMDVSNGGTFSANINGAMLSDNNRNGLRTVLTNGVTGTVNATNVQASRSGEHGVFVNVTNATLAPSTFNTVTVNDSGRNLTAGLRDGFNVDVTGSTATVSIVNATAGNSGANVSQQNGVRTIADGGSTLLTTITDSNLSLNSVSGISSQVRDAGTNSTVNVANVIANNSGQDGFFYDVAQGMFTSSVTGSAFNNSGRNGIRAVGGATNAIMNVTFDSTSVNNSVAEGVFFNINSGGGPGTFNFTYLPTAPSAILNSGGPNGVTATFTGPATLTGNVNFNLITIDGGINANNVGGATVIVTP